MSLLIATSLQPQLSSMQSKILHYLQMMVVAHMKLSVMKDYTHVILICQPYHRESRKSIAAVILTQIVEFRKSEHKINECNEVLNSGMKYFSIHCDIRNTYELLNHTQRRVIKSLMVGSAKSKSGDILVCASEFRDKGQFEVIIETQ